MSCKGVSFSAIENNQVCMVKIPGTDLPAAASGLRLQSRDLLKFGLLYNNHRIWKDKQVVPEKWLEESFQAHVQRPEGRRMASSYGYQFWLRKTR